MRTWAIVLVLAILPQSVFAQTPVIPTQNQVSVTVLTPEQLAQAIAVILAQQAELKGQIQALDAHLTQHDQQPMWITRFMTSPFGIILTSVAGTCVASKCWLHIGGK